MFSVDDFLGVAVFLVTETCVEMAGAGLLLLLLLLGGFTADDDGLVSWSAFLTALVAVDDDALVAVVVGTAGLVAGLTTAGDETAEEDLLAD